MSSGGQSNASQTPFAPNYGQAQGISGLGAGLTGGGFGSNMGGGNAYAQKFKQPPFGGGSQGPMLQDQGITDSGNAYAKRFQNPFVKDIPQTSPGMMLNPEYGGDLPSGTFRSFGPDSIKYVPDPNQPQSQTGGDIQYRDTKFRPGGGDIQYAGGTPGFYNQGGQGYGNPFGGGFGGGYDQGYGNPFGGFGGGYDQGYGNPFGGFGGGFGGGYGNPFGGFSGGYGGFNPMMGMGLGGMMGGYQGGFNPQSQAQAQMRAYQQNQQRNPNQPPPGMVRNPHYDTSYAMQDNVDAPGTLGDMKRQQFIRSYDDEPSLFV